MTHQGWGIIRTSVSRTYAPGMNLNTKIAVFSAVSAVVLVVVLTLISLYSFRQYSISSATEQVRTAAEIVRVQLTESMIHGVIDKREGFIGRLKEVEGFKSARVVRSPILAQQFNGGYRNELEPDYLEKQVFETRQPVFELSNEAGETLFRGSIPYVASSHGIPNCLSCHVAKEGDVLGAVSITLSIDHLKRKALLTVAGITAAVMLIALLSWLVLRRMIAPISRAAHDVEIAVHRALEGNFRSTVEQRTEDEIGHIAADLNRLLKFLDEGLERIGTSVARLIGRKATAGENQLQATIEMVDILARASHFKQAIEEDETRSEIHARLTQVLQNDFMLGEFSLYEVVEGRNQMQPLIVDGQHADECRWCNPEILVRNEACRAKRTGHRVDGINSPGICTAFQPPEGFGDRRHICMPIIQSGAVGNVLQIVANADNAALIDTMAPFISVYLEEAAPVLESKRLMETLREANLRDPMTGLNNRRFLEEYIDTLLGGVQRRKSHLSILMLDLDYFKMINDNYGHDAGDTVLKALAKTLRQSVRASDMVIRYGGEEFLIILQDTAAVDGVKVAENIRHAVEDLKIPVSPGTVLQKTISIGVADFPGDSPTFWQAIKFADVALYKAKDQGRNRVVRFTTELWDGNQSY